MTRIAPLLGLVLLAGCATAPPSEPAKPPPPPPPPAGIEPILHHPPEVAIRLLGAPRLDRKEGPARELQFAGGCILDVWYYPQAGGPPVATHADARMPDGRDIDAGACLRLLQAAAEAPVAAPPPAPAPTAPKRAKRKAR